jgi:hypothetical protein
VNGSVLVGDALDSGAGQSLNAQAFQSGNRVIVGVTKLGGGSGNAVPAGEEVIVRLSFRAGSVGTTTLTFSGAVSPQNPGGGPAALDSTGALVPSVQFDTAVASIMVV